MAELHLDDLDRAIIAQLEEDGRRAFREIGRTVGTSEATVRTRVKRLQDAGILRIVAFTDPRETNTQLTLTNLKVEPARHDEVIAALLEIPEITYLSTVMGRFDLCAEIHTRNTEHLYELMRGTIERIPGIQDTESVHVLKVHHLRYGTPIEHVVDAQD
ncbi:MAG: Lrp/AsnC family transcriptional regulator [Arthrobacter sp.]|jgi:Lrp/AsnC family transcriptional regulator for asnA, asnC and gidA|nr:Lrp/AsnC family transcriptional regulator [Arthrobacter sp.]